MRRRPCEFCTSTHLRWAYLRIVPSDGLDTEGGEATVFTCQFCHDLIGAEDWPTLIRRAEARYRMFVGYSLDHLRNGGGSYRS
jgi:hypothetical protein